MGKQSLGGPARRLLVALTTGAAILLSVAGCLDHSDRVNLTGLSRGIVDVGKRWQSATYRLDPASLARLFWDACLRRCHGFRFRAEGTAMGGTVGVYRWVERKVAGSLPWDLAGQMGSYRKVHRAHVTLVDAQFQGERVARVRFALQVDGILKTGHLRSDRGEMRMWLERRGLGTPWFVTGIRLDDMFTVVSVRPAFMDVTKKWGLDQAGSSWADWTDQGAGPATDWLPGPGFAVADFNDDNRPDLFVLSGDTGRVWLNRAQGRFTPLPPVAFGRGRRSPGGVTVADLDGDGREDLFVAFRFGTNLVLNSRGAGRFAPDRRAPPFQPDRGTVAAAALDADGDGALDLYLANHGTGRSGPVGPVPDELFLSDGNGAFRRKPQTANRPTRSRAACVVGPANAPAVAAVGEFATRLRRPGRSDRLNDRALFRMVGRACVAADLRGQGDEELVVLGVGSPWRWMYAQQGFPAPLVDAFRRRPWWHGVSDAVSGSRLLSAGVIHARRPATVSDRAAGFHQKELFPPDPGGWDHAGVAVDLDSDGKQELILLSGPGVDRSGRCLGPGFWARAFPRMWKARAWGKARSAGTCHGLRPSVRVLYRVKKNTWVDLSHVLGIDLPRAGRWVVPADLDGDGAVDLVIRHVGGTLRVFRNLLPQGNVLAVRIQGTRFNRFSVGAVVQVRVDGVQHPRVRRLSAVAGYADHGMIRVGLGPRDRVGSVEVEWPDGKRGVASDLSVNARYEIRHPGGGRTGSAGPPRPARPVGRPVPSRPGGPSGPVRYSGLGPDRLPTTPWPKSTGGSASLKSLAGSRATVVYLWSPPCAGCLGHMRKLALWAGKQNGVSVVAVHFALPCAGAKPPAPCGALPVGMAHLRWPRANQKGILKGATLPRVLVFGKNGRLVRAMVGPPDTDRLTSAVSD